MTIPTQEKAVKNTKFLPELIQSALDVVTEDLQIFATQSNFAQQIQIPFGTGVNASQFQAKWAKGNVKFPPIEILSQASINGAFGAFSAQTNRIYLSQEFLTANSQNINKIAAVLLEEYGHYVDSQLNQTDSPGDEGEIFAELVLGNSLSETKLAQLKTENDHTVANIGGQSVEIEMSFGTTGFIQFGSSGDDVPYGIKTDGSGNVSVTGFTGDNLAFVRKYDSSGNQLSSQQFSPSSSVSVYEKGIITDSSGNIYISSNNYDSGKLNTFVEKYDANSNRLWTQRFNSDYNFLGGINTDNAGNIYVTGTKVSTYYDGNYEYNYYIPTSDDDIFVAKYNSSGTLLWSQQYGDFTYYDLDYFRTIRDSEQGRGVSTDSNGNVYVIASTNHGSTPQAAGSDGTILLIKYNSSGTGLWGYQFGTGTVGDAHAISTDNNGNVYVAGNGYNSYPGYTSGNFVAKFNTDGTRLWIKQTDFRATGITADSGGNVYFTGWTDGTLPNNVSFGYRDAFLAKYDASGTQLWIKQFGSSGSDAASGVSIDSIGNIYVTGSTDGSLPGNSNLGGSDAFIVGFDSNGNPLENPPSVAISDATITEGDNGVTYATFNVTLSRTGYYPITVNYATANGTAIAGSDYIATSGTLTFAANDSSPKSITVEILGDKVVERDENFLINLTNITNATISDNQGQGTIVNDDSAVISINDVTIAEGYNGTTNAVFTVSLSNAVDTAITLNHATSDGTATTTDSDYIALPTTSLTFNGETSKTIIVLINGDTKVEGNETFFVNLSNLQTNGSNVTLTDNQGQGTIINDDSAVISINDVTVTEGNNGTTNAIFTVNLSNAVDTAISLYYEISDGTATVGDKDYQIRSTTPLTFNPGEISKTITVAVNGDNNLEGNETFFVNLSNLQTNGRNVTLADNQGQGTIINDDLGTLSIVKTTDGHETGPVGSVFTLTRTGDLTAALNVNYSLSGTATLGSDYTNPSGGIATFAPGAATATITFPTINDTIIDPNETIIVKITPPSGYNVPSNSPATAIMAVDKGWYDNSGYHDSTNANYFVGYDEGRLYRNWMVFNLPYFSQPIISARLLINTYKFSSTDNNETYELRNVTTPISTLIAGGYSNGSIYDDLGDGTIYGSRNFTSRDSNNPVTINLNSALINALNANAGQAFALGGSISTLDFFGNSQYIYSRSPGISEPSDVQLIITNDDGATATINDALPTITLAISPNSITEDGTSNLIYTFTRTGNLTNSLTVNLGVAGTATFNNDYTQTGATTFNGTTATITFAANSNTAILTIDPTADHIVESDETVALTLVSGTGYTVGTTTTVTGTITNDDEFPNLVVTNINAPTSSGFGQQITVSWTVQNQGKGPTIYPSWNDSIFYSKDAIFGNSDDNLLSTVLTDLGSYNYILNPDQSYTLSTTVVTYYDDFSTGGYLFVKTDKDNYEPESNEADNIASVPIVVDRPNLVVTNINAPTSSDIGQPITVSWTVQNQGKGPTVYPSWNDNIVYSKDAVFGNSDDTLLSTVLTDLGSYNYILNPNQSYTLSTTITPPYDYLSSGGYLFVKTDKDNYEPESNESDNVASVAITKSVTTLSINDVIITEGNSGTKNATFTVTLSKAVNNIVTVNYGTANNTATAGNDYVAIPTTTLTFNPNETTKTITVQINSDNQVELDETFFINLSNLQDNGSSITLADNQGQATITNDDNAAISINDVTITEGNNTTTNAIFTVNLSNTVDTAITLNYATSDGTATTADNDYLGITLNSLIFNPGEISKTIIVPIKKDTKVEGDETFFVNLSNLQAKGRNVTLADNQGQGIITNDDSAAISINDVTITEGNNGTTNAIFTVNLSNAVDTAITLNYATSDGTATTADNDYLALATTSLTFNPGEISKTIIVPIKGDTKVEGNETFFVNLSNLQANGRNVTLADNQGQGTITNDDTSATQPWIKQFGTSTYDSASEITIDSSGNIYVTGQTYGSLPGNTKLGSYDSFVTKYNASGTQLWTKQFGTSLWDDAEGIRIDSNGNIYLTGATSGTFPNNPTGGYDDAFIAKYDANGNQLWVKQFGSDNHDASQRISIDSNDNIYVTGWTSGLFPYNYRLGYDDAFIAKYDVNGYQLWVKQFGSILLDRATGISNDSIGNIYVTGWTTGNLPGNSTLGGNDAFITKYNAAGNQLWVKQFGTASDDVAKGITTDSNGNVYVTGSTEGSLPGNSNLGDVDAFVAKYDASGNQLWIKQFGTSNFDDNYDQLTGIITDSSGNVYVTGSTEGSLPGYSNLGSFDAFVAKYDANGNQLWVKQFGSSNWDEAHGISSDSNGNVYVTGYTYGSLPGNSNLGGSDAFIVGFDTNGNLLNTATPLPTLAINDVTITEGNNGTTNAIFTVTRTGTASGPITVNYATANDTAVTGSDYTVTNGTLTFATNETTKTITVPILGDAIVEPDETFFINLTNATNATIADTQGLGKITNDDTSVSLSINPTSVNEDGAANLVYTFTRVGVTTNALTVNYTVGGTATFNSDYTQLGAASFSETTGTVTFNANYNTATVTIDPTADNIVESNETVALTLANGTGYTIAKTSAVTGIILNDDIVDTNGNSLTNRFILGTSGADILVGAAQDDIITGLQGNDILTGGGGKDQFVYQTIRDTGDIIKDFQVGQDKIVITDLLNSLGYHGSNPIADGYLKFGARGNDTILLIDEDGIGSKRALPFITVENVSMAAIQSADNFVF